MNSPLTAPSGTETTGRYIISFRGGRRRGGARFSAISAWLWPASPPMLRFPWHRCPAGSQFSGKGVKVAVLDTGLLLAHPDFLGRSIVSRSFLSGVGSANDGHGHGTHCTGAACGPLQPAIGPRYGAA
jgi:subtilisin family serine protease